MNNIKLVIIFIVLITIQHSIAQKSYKKESNAYYKLNKNIQKVINKLFLLLRLNKNFTNEYNSRLLLSMHANMKNIAENNFEMYKGIRKICKLDVAKKMKGSLFRLDKLIEVFVEDELLPGNNTNKNQRRSFGLKLTSIEIPGDSAEAITFLRDYLNTIDDMQIVGIETPAQKIKQNYQKYAQLRLVKSKNLRKWRVQKGTYDTEDTRRIYHGKLIGVKKFPFVVSVHIQDEFVCAGSIISKDMVLTAATCLQTLYNTGVLLRDTPEGVEVRIGSNYVNKDGETKLISKVFFHPEFDPVTLNNNLAILKIKKQLHFVRKNKRIRRIDFAGLNPGMEKQDVVLLGWGEAVTDDEANNLEPLTFTALNQFEISKCVDIYSSTYVTTSNFCAGLKGVGSGACRRDVGGPGVIGSFLVGVVSFGPPICGTPDAPTVFTNLGYHLGWINSVVKQKAYSPLKSGTTLASTPAPLGDNTTNVAQLVGNILTDLLANGINLDELIIGGEDTKNQDTEEINVESLFVTETQTEPVTTRLTTITQGPKQKRILNVHRLSATRTTPKIDNNVNPFLVALNKITKFINLLKVPFENALKNISVDDAAVTQNLKGVVRMGGEEINTGDEKPEIIDQIDPDTGFTNQYAENEPMVIGFGGLDIKSLPPTGTHPENYMLPEWYVRKRTADNNYDSAGEAISIEIPISPGKSPHARNVINKRIIANKFLQRYLAQDGKMPPKKVMKTNDILRFLLKQKSILQKKAQEFEKSRTTSVTPGIVRKFVDVNETIDYPNFSEFVGQSHEMERLMDQQKSIFLKRAAEYKNKITTSVTPVIIRKSVGENDTIDYPNYSDFVEQSQEIDRLMAAYNFDKIAKEQTRRNIWDYINIM